MGLVFYLLVDKEAARVLTSEAADRIADLVRYGVHFDATDVADGFCSGLGVSTLCRGLRPPWGTLAPPMSIWK